jgi:hypothetical protein
MTTQDFQIIRFVFIDLGVLIVHHVTGVFRHVLLQVDR